MCVINGHGAFRHMNPRCLRLLLAVTLRSESKTVLLLCIRACHWLTSKDVRDTLLSLLLLRATFDLLAANQDGQLFIRLDLIEHLDFLRGGDDARMVRVRVVVAVLNHLRAALLEGR